MSNAIEFTIDFQEFSQDEIHHLEAIKLAMKKNLHLIKRQECTETSIIFVDNSKAIWYGSGFTIQN